MITDDWILVMFWLFLQLSNNLEFSGFVIFSGDENVIDDLLWVFDIMLIMLKRMERIPKITRILHFPSEEIFSYRFHPCITFLEIVH